tara:strand:- start:109375 stop:109542 length:168 start_codon:yes stop_codon:yes gene_type:complete
MQIFQMVRAIFFLFINTALFLKIILLEKMFMKVKFDHSFSRLKTNQKKILYYKFI